ncbi:hypothetical protein J2129_002507 [Methanofollis sp. W23]|uniref:hypothetical protein n=1 Tax=Methanofollis sp. W23 TaxID=2817849 RepID=UPI001AE762DE|nr:hypothetical protein [Methanofollis sp. W23]MBP2147053.1 hypothetical protein [Methanofollis sp. W23]
MDERIWFGLIVVTGLLASVLGQGGLVGIGALIIAVAVISRERDHWLALLAAGAFVAVVVGLSSPLWSIPLILVVLGWVQDSFGLFTSPGDMMGFLLFAGVATVFLLLALGNGHVSLPLVFLIVFLVFSGLFISFSWYSLVWSARRGEEE